MNFPSECSKMRSESSEEMWKTTGCFYKQLENQNNLGELFEKNMHMKFWREIGCFLICILRCWTSTI